VKLILLRVAICFLGAFAAYYAYFLGSVFYELYPPNAPNTRFCATAQFWALQAAAILFAPPALLGSAALWFIGKRKDTIGNGFSGVSRIVLVILGLCAVVNLLILMPAP
jgi:hypothetical protein